MLIQLNVTVNLRDLAVFANTLKARGASARTLRTKTRVIAWALREQADKLVAEGQEAPARDIDALAVLMQMGMFKKDRPRKIPLGDYLRLKRQIEDNPGFIASASTDA